MRRPGPLGAVAPKKKNTQLCKQSDRQVCLLQVPWSRVLTAVIADDRSESFFSYVNYSAFLQINFKKP